MRLLQRSTDPRTRPDDGALLLRARRLAKRSRAAAACLPCKATKSKCSDFRPCARCSELKTKVCLDLQAESIATTESKLIAWNENANSFTANYRTVLSANIIPASAWPRVASEHFVHCGSNMAPREQTPNGLDAAMPTDEQVPARWGKGVVGKGRESQLLAFSKARDRKLQTLRSHTIDQPTAYFITLLH
jgi:hypothetical protein